MLDAEVPSSMAKDILQRNLKNMESGADLGEHSNPSAAPTEGDNIKVAIRVRPFAGESEALSSSIISIEANEIVITDPTYQLQLQASRSPSAPSTTVEDIWQSKFLFDNCFHATPGKSRWSTAQQEDVFEQYGHCMVQNAAQGYNCSLFAYGQTGSGKTYTMLGNVDMGYDLSTNEELGFIPRLCKALFDWTEANRSEKSTLMVEASYFEIYNEKVFDLLTPSSHKARTGLRVREHPKTGSYVEDLKSIAVNDYAEVRNLLQQGTEARTTAATLCNQSSSRSHAVFQIQLTQISQDEASSCIDEKSSRISLVDLAGSERVRASGVSGVRLKEAQNINKSLSTLSDVIKALSHSGDKPRFVPYRNSTLTWLLKDSLGGNAKTVMLAAISPEAASYVSSMIGYCFRSEVVLSQNESMMTLKYAERVKRIVNKAKVNTGSNADVINSLKQEIKELKQQLQQQQQGNSEATESVMLLQDRLATEEKLMQQLTLPWEQKRRESELHLERMNQENKVLRQKQEALQAEMESLKREKSVRDLQKTREEHKKKERQKRHKLQLEYQLKRRKDDQKSLVKRLSDGEARIFALQEELEITRAQRNELECSLLEARQKIEEQRIKFERVILKEKGARREAQAELEKTLVRTEEAERQVETIALDCLDSKLALYLYLDGRSKRNPREMIDLRRDLVRAIVNNQEGGAGQLRELLLSVRSSGHLNEGM